jgi:lysophospholipase
MAYFISHESNVSDYPNNDFMAFFEAKVSTGVWKQASGVESFYAFIANEQATQCVVISQGRSESVLKYAEFIYELYKNGFCVFIMDHQGQGLSSRLLSNPHIGFVNTFDDYVEDLHCLLDKVLSPLLLEQTQKYLPKVLFCHSMGGAIGTLYVQKYPTTFTKLILSAPMLGVAAPIPEWLTKSIATVVIKLRTFLRLPAIYLWGQGDYQASPFKGNQLTNSDIRYRVFREMMDNYPQNQLGGISFEWLLQAIIAMRIARAGAKAMILPTLVLQAEQDQIVDNTIIEKFANDLPNAKLVLVANAQHELLFEQNEARSLTLTTILDFLSDNE